MEGNAALALKSAATNGGDKRKRELERSGHGTSPSAPRPSRRGAQTACLRKNVAGRRIVPEAGWFPLRGRLFPRTVENDPDRKIVGKILEAVRWLRGCEQKGSG